MIFHKHKFIYIKTEKTAGTRLKVALSKFCGKDDIITPISSKDEKIRSDFGFLGAQNYVIPFSTYSAADFVRALIRKKRLRFENHCPAAFVKKYIGKEIWDSYFKFSVERNPWDKVISFYYWIVRNQKEPKLSLSEFIEQGRAFDIKGLVFIQLTTESP